MADVWTTKTLQGLLSTDTLSNIDNLFANYNKGLGVYNKVKQIADDKVGLMTSLVSSVQNYKDQLLASGFSFIFLAPELSPSASWIGRLEGAVGAPVADSNMYSVGVCIIIQGANHSDVVSKATALENLFKIS